MKREVADEKFHAFLGELSSGVEGNVELSEIDELRGFVSVITNGEVCWRWNVAMDTSGAGSFLVSVDNFEGILDDGIFTTVEDVLISLPHPNK